MRRPLSFLLLLAIFLVAGSRALSSTNDRKWRRPNVLFIIADQWRAQALGYAGDPNVHTPHLDALARQSVDFTNATSSVPVCCPTRATLLTGQRALTHGVFMNDVPLSPGALSAGKVLGRAGYDTGFIGKWHVDGHGRSSFIPRERRQGFDYWKVLECTHNYNDSPYYADDPGKRKWEGYDAAAQTRDAEAYLREHAHANRPFALFLSWGPPHEPYLTAPQRYQRLYDPAKLTLRPNIPATAVAQARRELAGYYAHCTALDDLAGGLLDTLRELNLAENTLVVFTSDHGDMLWSQGAQKKQQPYEESARVPLLFRYPRRLGPDGRRVSAPIGTEDIMPTLLRLCDVAVPYTVEGGDYSGAMRGGKAPGDGAALVYCPAPFGQWSRAVGGREYRAVRTERYTYARDLNGPWLLFDNQNDPYQQDNLVGRPEHAALQREMEGRLQAKLKETHDEFLPAGEYIRRWGYTVDATGTVPYTP